MFNEDVHNTLKRKNVKFAFAVSIFLLAFVVGRMILTRFYVQEELHYYLIDKSNIFVASLDYIIAAFVVVIYLFSFFAYKRRKENHDYKEALDCFVQGNQAQVFSALLAGFLFIASSVFQMYTFIKSGGATDVINKIKIAPFFPGRSQSFMDGKILVCVKLFFSLDCLIFFISALSAVYFFKTAAMNLDLGETLSPALEEAEAEKRGNDAHKYSSAHIIFSFMPVIWAFLNVFKCFLDMSKNVNSPVRIYELMSFLFLSAYFVSESRMLVGRKETSKFFTFAYISVIITAASSLPNLIWSSFWILSPNSDLIVYAVQLSIVIYIFSRIYSQMKYGKFLLLR